MFFDRSGFTQTNYTYIKKCPFSSLDLRFSSVDLYREADQTNHSDNCRLSLKLPRHLKKMQIFANNFDATKSNWTLKKYAGRFTNLFRRTKEIFSFLCIDQLKIDLFRPFSHFLLKYWGKCPFLYFTVKTEVFPQYQHFVFCTAR